MKNIILSSLLIGILTGCKKEAENTAYSEPVSDSASVSAEALPVASLKSMTPEQTTEFLQTKNDTLYVTNFFATWCGPCIREIPHFREKIQELKGQPVKITFISLDSRDIWNTEVPKFVDRHAIRKNTVLLDGGALDETFFKANFNEWTGDAIPFTYMRKGDKTDEFLGMMTAELLNSKIESFKK